MNIAAYLLLTIYLVFLGADRINFGGGFLESFQLFPHLVISFIIFLYILLFRLKDLEFEWIVNKKSAFLSIICFLMFTIISIIFSIDIIFSAKRLVLLTIIISTVVLILSLFSSDELKEYFYYSSLLGSILFFIFNILLFSNWIGYISHDSNIINLNPDYIAYFIPRLGGFSSDVNRGVLILVIYTFFIYIYDKKSPLSNLIILMNTIFIFASLSRTAIGCFFITFLIYIIFYSTKVEKIKVLVILPISFIILSNIVDYYSSNNVIDIESALEERLTLNDYGHNTSTGIHFKLIDEGLRIAFSDLKIFLIGSGLGTSYKVIEGFGMSKKKKANFHSQYLSIFVENGFFACLSFLFLTIIIPIFRIRNKMLPLIIGIFCFNQLYQLTNEPMYWFTILYYYKFNEHV